MKYTISFLLWVALGVGLVGCAPSPIDDRYWTSPRPLGKTHKAYHPGAHQEGSPKIHDPTVTEPVGELSLHGALAAALLGNPELASFAYSVRVAEAKAFQTGRWPNPELTLEFENFGGSGDASGFDALETTISLSQTFPLGSDVWWRRRLADLHGQLAGWDYEAARIAVLTDAAKRFVDVLATQRLVDLAKESLELARQVRDSIDRRVNAGDAPVVERVRAVTPVVTAKLNLYDAQQALEAARRNLASIWGGVSPRFTKAVGDLDVIQPAPPASALVGLINQNPDVARWVVEMTARQAEMKLTQAEALPDLTAALGYRRLNDSNDNALVAGVSIPLPVFDRRRGDILAAKLGAAAAHQQRRAVEIRVQTTLADAYARLTSAYSKAATLRDEALPPATEAYAAIRRAFDHGDLRFLDVIDAEHTLIDFRRQYLHELKAYHRAVAEIEGLIGQPLDAANLLASPEPNTLSNPNTQDSQP